MSRSLFPDITVNGETVGYKAVAAEAQNHDAPAGKPGIAWRKAAHAIAIRTLLLQEARRQKLTAEPVEVGPGRFETEEEALIRALLERAISTELPSPSLVRAEWEKDPSRYRTPPLWEVSHILCACDPSDKKTKVKAHARATALSEMALADPRSFSALAAGESDCGSKSNGGALGQLGPGDTVPEFEAALRQLDEGQITPEPVASRHGYHIIRLDAVAPGDILPFETVRPKISEAIEKAQWTRAARDFTAQLIALADITGADIKPI